jgi:glyoxylase-like metal-dependent hydrolase (beta-lactamase superfamily II)
MPTVEIAPGVTRIDHHFRGSPGVIASFLLHDARGQTDELTLIEAGPASTTETLLAEIHGAGFDPGRITRLLLTHVHLDHAGAAGRLVRQFPDAQVFVHPVGVRHLVDPSRLLASATRIYGALMQPLWGDVLPVPAERVTALDDGATLDASGHSIRAVDTPGHAKHHLAFHDAGLGVLFAGDVAGVRLDSVRHVRPPTPPPDLDPALWLASIARIRALHPSRIVLTHFGAFDDVDWHLDDLTARLFTWTGAARAMLETDATNTKAVVDTLRRWDAPILGDPSLATRYEQAANYDMSVSGFAYYFERNARNAASPSAS